MNCLETLNRFHKQVQFQDKGLEDSICDRELYENIRDWAEKEDQRGRKHLELGCQLFCLAEASQAAYVSLQTS